MPSTLTKIGLVLLVVFLLPAIFYSVRELKAVQENELMIEEIYNNQLEAILFSVNQYSEDIVRSWTQDWSGIVRDSLLDDPEAMNQFFDENYAISEVFLLDSLGDQAPSLYAGEGERLFSENAPRIQTMIRDRQDVIERLYRYRESGYLKIQPLTSDSVNLTTLVFLSGEPKLDHKLYGFVLNAEVFVNDFLGPRIHAIAQDQFIISVHDHTNAVPFYSTANSIKKGVKPEPQKALWLLPDYYITIRLDEQDKPSLAQQRFTTNLFLIIGLNAVLLLGAWFVFRTIKKEIELAQIKSDFVSNVSHEIRTPLALITMFSETLLMGRVKSDEKRQEYYRIVNHEAQRLTSMVNKILNFSKMEAGKHHFHFEAIDLNVVVATVLESYDFHLKNKGFTYRFYPAEVELTITGDRESIAEALINLLDNAIKYSEDHKEISIRTGINEDYYFVEVQDRGIGISETHQKSIFEKFYRVTQDATADRKGTGLGLSLVQYIMNAHKGSIELTSHKHEGSKFRLNFPIRYKVSKLIASE
uniref:histidine kinase n=1 Tax=Roseihalotalea indica TaxID=2867963 RepID=A0AA49JD90_9BACT|nr:HAMP domain-containing sensor histidine kinase [Tunicatimonas sp. TK19036]